MAVTMKDLHVTDEDFIFYGDLRLLGETLIENGNLTVTGDLILAQDDSDVCSFHITNGDLTAKNVWTEFADGTYDDMHGYSCPCNGACQYFDITNGDINITDGSLDLGDSDINNVCNISINRGDLICGHIFSSFSIYVENKIRAWSITTVFDLYCYDGDFFDDIYCGRDMYVENCCDLNGHDVYVKGSFETSSLVCVREIIVGK